jgi:hypothetical protein
MNIVALSMFADKRKDVLTYKENCYKEPLRVVGVCVCVPFWQNHVLERNFNFLANNQKNKFKVVHSEGKRN